VARVTALAPSTDPAPSTTANSAPGGPAGPGAQAAGDRGGVGERPGQSGRAERGGAAKQDAERADGKQDGAEGGVGAFVAQEAAGDPLVHHVLSVLSAC
jgi:hypothetical protein